MANFSRRASQGPEVKARCADVVLELSGMMKNASTGALVQMWLPETLAGGGEVVLATQGLAYSITGVGDLLALFRCISCRYNFATDVLSPSRLGAVGRVYTTLQPEMSCDLQKYQKQVYLRVQEAQRCSVHSTLLMPVFSSSQQSHPVAVLEIVKSSKEICFPELVDQISEALSRVKLYGPDLKSSGLAVGLRCWPLTVDITFDHLRPGESDGSVAGEDDNKNSQVVVKSEVWASGSTEKQEGTAESHNEADLASRPLQTAAGSPCQHEAGQAEEQNCAIVQCNASVQSPSIQQASRLQALSSQGMGVSAGPSSAPHAHRLLTPGNQNPLHHEDHGQAVPKSAGENIPTAGLPAAPATDEEVHLDPEHLRILLEMLSSTKRRRRGTKRARMGSGKNLTYEELKQQFGYGLKEAAARLGICPTTLKRACRRNGIDRWPCRQLAKLSKAIKGAGYSGSLPKELLESVLSGKLPLSAIAEDLKSMTDPSPADADPSNPMAGSSGGRTQMGFTSPPTSLGLLLELGNDADKDGNNNVTNAVMEGDGHALPLVGGCSISAPYMVPHVLGSSDMFYAYGGAGSGSSYGLPLATTNEGCWELDGGMHVAAPLRESSGDLQAPKAEPRHPGQDSGSFSVPSSLPLSPYDMVNFLPASSSR